MAQQEYNDRITSLAERYNDRVVAFLNQIRAVLIDNAYPVGEVFQMWDDEYRWVFTTLNHEGSAGEGTMDFRVEIAEQRLYEGEDSGPGINWGLFINSYGGLVVGGWQPFNFTEDVWVDSYNDDEVEERFQILERADLTGVIDTVGAVLPYAVVDTYPTAEARTPVIGRFRYLEGAESHIATMHDGGDEKIRADINDGRYGIDGPGGG